MIKLLGLFNLQKDILLIWILFLALQHDSMWNYCLLFCI